MENIITIWFRLFGNKFVGYGICSMFGVFGIIDYGGFGNVAVRFGFRDIYWTK